jgi:hypothetical protein
MGFCNTVMYDSQKTCVCLCRPMDFSLHNGQTDCGVHPASYPVSTGVLSSVLKLLECEASSHPHLVPMYKNAWSYAPTAPYICMTRYLMKHQGRLCLHLHVGSLCDLSNLKVFKIMRCLKCVFLYSKSLISN